jgi:hypothetical protein
MGGLIGDNDYLGVGWLGARIIGGDLFVRGAPGEKDRSTRGSVSTGGDPTGLDGVSSNDGSGGDGLGPIRGGAGSIGGLAGYALGGTRVGASLLAAQGDMQWATGRPVEL